MQERVKEKATKAVAELDARLHIAQKEAEAMRRARILSHLPSYETHEADAVASANLPRLANITPESAASAVPAAATQSHANDKPAPAPEVEPTEDFKE